MMYVHYCNQASENASHLCLLRPFAREVWTKGSAWTNSSSFSVYADIDESVEQWWHKLLAPLSLKRHSSVAAIL